MKNRTADEVLREKLDSISPLTGGVVYGKEEAWERLQGRMDKKKNRRIPLLYPTAAAAVLLLLVCLRIAFDQPRQPIVHNTPQTRTEAPIAPQRPVAATAQNTDVQQKKMVVHPHHQPRKERPAQTLQVQPPATLTELVTNTPTVVKATDLVVVEAPTTPTAINKMKVVHINELDGSLSVASGDESVAEGAGMDVSKMKVTPITDATQLENDLMIIFSQSKPSLVHNLFQRPGPYDHPGHPGEPYIEQHNILKSILTIQN